jgi:hypothetical protein
MTGIHEQWSVRWARFGYWFGAIALAALLFAATVDRRQVSADESADSNAKGALPADLALVSGDAVGFVTIRVADLWSSPFIKSFRGKLAKQEPELADGLEKEFPKSFEQFAGAALDDIERLTLLLSGPHSAQNLEMPVIIRTKNAVNRGKIIDTLSAVESHSAGVPVYESRRRGVRLRFINDKTFVLFAPNSPLQPASLASGGSPLNEALALAAGKHAVVAGVVPAAWLEQYESERPEPLLPLLLSSHPLLLARFGVLTLDLDHTSRLQLRLAYRKEATAAVGEDALQAALHTLQRHVRRALADREGDNEARLIQRILRVWDQLAVEQEGKTVRASLDMKEDLTVALAEAAARIGVSARGTKSQNNLKQLGLAMHNYHDTMGAFPPAVVTDASGKPLYSWRVLLLPYLEANNVYQQFKLDEPWDSLNNKRLLAQMPALFAAPGANKDEPYTTHYQVFVGGGALFDAPDRVPRNQFGPPRGPHIAHITDGTSNTIMIVESAEAVPWSKPQDLSYNPTGPLPKLGGVVSGGFNCVAADGAVHFLKNSTPTEVLRALITRQGGEIVYWPDSGPPQKGNTPPSYQPLGTVLEKTPFPSKSFPVTPYMPRPTPKYPPKGDFKVPPPERKDGV